MPRLVHPIAGGAYLPPAEVLRRLREEFAVVVADSEAGGRGVEDVALLLAQLSVSDALVAEELQRADETTAVEVADADDPNAVRLSFALAPHRHFSVNHWPGERWAEGEQLLERLGRALGYVVAEPWEGN